MPKLILTFIQICIEPFSRQLRIAPQRLCTDADARRIGTSKSLQQAAFVGCCEKWDRHDLEPLTRI